MRILTILIFFLISTSTFAQGDRLFQREKKVALVIGNSNYAKGNLYGKPINDATDISATLKRLGFQVFLHKDLNQRGMKKAIQEFSTAINKADIALFFFAGHGMQVKGENFLLPLGAEINQEWEVEHEAIPANRLLSAMEDAQAKVNLVILDACRNNPYTRAWRSASNNDQGLSGMSGPKGSLIAFATSPKDVAANGTGRNSPFTTALLNHIEKPNVTIEQLFTNVRKEVYRTTNERQLPWSNSSIIEDVYLRRTKLPPTPSPSSISSPTPTTQDSDGDGLLDHIDKCPNEYGPVANGGCQEKEKPTFTGNSGTFKDNRDNQAYRWVRLKDGNIWMAENLNYQTSDSYCYNDDNDNCDEYGRLYTWQAARKACPSGWRLPTDDEWRAMAKYYGGCDDDASDGGKAAYAALMQSGNSGFSALLGGGRSSDGDFYSLGNYGDYWSSTELSSSDAWYYGVNSDYEKFGRYNGNKSWAFSCRCLQD